VRDRQARDEYDAMTVHAYPKYQEMMRSCAAFDFDDLIVEPVRLFERDPEVARRWADRFRFVMVDEFQDTNSAQLRMVSTGHRSPELVVSATTISRSTAGVGRTRRTSCGSPSCSPARRS
jgi:hypothetical protein